MEAPRSPSSTDSIVNCVDDARAYLANQKAKGALLAQLSPCSSSLIVEQARVYLARSPFPSPLQSLTQGCDSSACALKYCFGSHVSECLDHDEHVPISKPPLSPSYVVNMEPSSDGSASCEDATVAQRCPFSKTMPGWTGGNGVPSRCPAYSWRSLCSSLFLYHRCSCIRAVIAGTQWVQSFRPQLVFQDKLVWERRLRGAKRLFYVLHRHAGLLGVWIRLWESFYRFSRPAQRRQAMYCAYCGLFLRCSWWDIAAFYHDWHPASLHSRWDTDGSWEGLYRELYCARCKQRRPVTVGVSLRFLQETRGLTMSEARLCMPMFFTSYYEDCGDGDGYEHGYGSSNALERYDRRECEKFNPPRMKEYYDPSDEVFDEFAEFADY